MVAVSRELGRAARPQTPEPGDIDVRYVALGAFLLLEERVAAVVRTAAEVGRAVGKPVVAAAMPLTPEWMRRDAAAFVRHLADYGHAAADTGAGEAAEIVEVLATDVTRDPSVIALIEGIVGSILPVAIERLATDEHVRLLVQQQSRGMIGDISDAARTRAADGDEAVQRFLSRRRRKRGDAPDRSRDQPAVAPTLRTEP